MVGDFGGPVVGHVAHGDAAPPRGLNIDQVVADAEAANDAEVRRPLEHRVVDGHLQAGDQGVDGAPFGGADRGRVRFEALDETHGSGQRRPLDREIVDRLHIGVEYPQLKLPTHGNFGNLRNGRIRRPALPPALRTAGPRRLPDDTGR